MFPTKRHLLAQSRTVGRSLAAIGKQSHLVGDESLPEKPWKSSAQISANTHRAADP